MEAGNRERREAWTTGLTKALADADVLPDVDYPRLAAAASAYLSEQVKQVQRRAEAKDRALEFAEGAISDAIYLEDGLDGDAGERVLHICQEARLRGTFDKEPFDRSKFLSLGPREPSEELRALRAAVSWALGEGDSDFGEHMPPPDKMTGRIPKYWWRTELRKRADAHPSAPGPYVPGEAERQMLARLVYGREVNELSRWQADDVDRMLPLLARARGEEG